ncbi:hypothetical protein ACLOJK_011361 [Asimina triloba]
MADWFELPMKLLELIAENLTFLPDIALNAGHGGRQVDVLFPIYPAKCLGSNSHCFFSDADDRIHGSPLKLGNRETCRGSAGSWLLCIGLMEIRLFNPFVAGHCCLPPIATFHTLLDNIYRHSSKCNYIKKGAFCLGRGFKDCLVMWHPFVDVIFANGRFYAVNKRGEVVVCDVGPHPTATQFAPPVREDYPDGRYLVESLGEFFQVTREMQSYNTEEDVGSANGEANAEADGANDVNGIEPNDNDHNDADNEEEEEYNNYRTAWFDVFKLDPRESKWVEAKSLGERAFFLGTNSSFSVVKLIASTSLMISWRAMIISMANVGAFIWMIGDFWRLIRKEIMVRDLGSKSDAIGNDFQAADLS